MKKIGIVRKLTAAILVIACGVSAQTAQNVADFVNSLNGLSASINNATNTVTITGTYTGNNPMEININSGVTVNWRATAVFVTIYPVITISGNGVFNVESGQIRNIATSLMGNDLFPSAAIANGSGTLNIFGGTVESTVGTAIRNTNPGTVNISGGRVSTVSGRAIDIRSGNLNISGTGEVSAHTNEFNNNSGTAIRVINAANVSVSGGTVSATGGLAIDAGSSGTINISGNARITSAGFATISVSSNTTTNITGGIVENTWAHSAGRAYSGTTGLFSLCMLRIGNNPTIAGIISTNVGRLEVLSSFSPSPERRYTLDFPTFLTNQYVIGNIAVVNGGNFRNNFILSNSAWTLVNTNGNLTMTPMTFHTIRWNVNGVDVQVDNNVAYGTMPAFRGSTPTRPATAQHTFTFTGWSPTVSMVVGNQTYTAQFSQTLRSYNVTFNSNGGTAVGTQTRTYGSTATEPTTPTRTGYIFDGWYQNSGFTGTQFNFATPITANITLFAKWKCVEHELNDLDNWIITKYPTCTETGNRERIRTCVKNGCEYGELEIDNASIELPALKHTYGELEVIELATCETNGYKAKVCFLCGNETDIEPIEKLGHNFIALGTLISEANCTNPAKHKAKCSRDNCRVEHEIDLLDGEAKLGHSAVTGIWTSGTPATCTAPSTRVEKCTRCDVNIAIENQGALGHTFNEWQTTTHATCVIAEIQTEKCGVCGILGEEIRTLEKLAHTFGEPITISATCEAGGSITQNCNRDGCEEIKILEILARLTGGECNPVSIFDTDALTISATGIRFAINPVSDKAEISVILPNNERATETKIVIYDMTGNVVFNYELRITNYELPIVWDLRNSAGRFVANGTYLVIAEVKTANEKIYAYSARLGVKR